jgi:hypothetical protein
MLHRRTMWRLVLLASGCAVAVEPPPEPPLPVPIETVWTDTIHAGDLIALVPGTGSYDFLPATIEPLSGEQPVVDVRAFPKVADDAIVFEQAIAAAHRAGFSNADLEAGALTFGLWGAGFTRLHSFVYVSYDGIHLPIEILGGASACAHGRVVDNLLSYTTANIEHDARALYVAIQTWLAAHPGGNAVVASHSYGGAVAEYLAFELPTIAERLGPLANGATIPFTIAAGVPALVVGYQFAGPSFRTLDGRALYEIDRPDDPVHAMNPSGNPDGHQYDILIGDAYLGRYAGAYGITTTELSCRGVPGECPLP